MQIIAESHVDHALTPAQVKYITDAVADERGFFIRTLELPEELGTVPCGLHGPLMGDAPVLDAEVEHAARGARAYPSRLCSRAPRPTSKVTIIAGPHGDLPCVLYTAFGGPLAPQEPGELKIQREAAEQALIDYCKSYVHSAGPLDRSPGYVELTAKRDAIRDKHNASRAFWAEHALSR